VKDWNQNSSTLKISKTKDKIQAGASVSVNPNPAHSMINLEITITAADEYRISLFDCSGRELMEEIHELEPGTISISLQSQFLTPGIYFTHILGTEIDKLLKIIVQ